MTLHYAVTSSERMRDSVTRTPQPSTTTTTTTATWLENLCQQRAGRPKKYFQVLLCFVQEPICEDIRKSGKKFSYTELSTSWCKCERKMEHEDIAQCLGSLSTINTPAFQRKDSTHSGSDTGLITTVLQILCSLISATYVLSQNRWMDDERLCQNATNRYQVALRAQV